MGCDCATTSFNEYFTDEAERLAKQLLDFPETFKDVWTDLASVEKDAVAEEALVAVAQGALSNPGIQALIDLLKSEVESALGQTMIPRFEGALDELSRVKDTQEAVKVLAGIVFILWSDSIFHVMNMLAKKILRLGVLKVGQLGQLQAAISVATAAMDVFAAAGVDSQDIRDLILSAAEDVASAEALVSRMKKSAAAKAQIRRPLVDRAVSHLQDAIDKLADDSVDADLVASGASSALLASAEPLAVASGGMLLASMYMKEIRSVTASLKTTNRQISAAVVAFLAGVDQYKTAPMTNYQLSILTTVGNRLSAARSSMQAAARGGEMKEIAEGFATWVPSIGVAQSMLSNLPPEIREQQDLNAELLAAYDETCRQVRSINGSHIVKGVETTIDLEKAVDRMVYMMENLFSQVRTGSIVDHGTYLTKTSSGLPFPEIDFVRAEMDLGVPQEYRVVGVTVEVAAVGVPAISRLDESMIQTTFVMDAMAAFLEVQPPENALITTLLELLKVLQMGRGRDLLMMGNITDFMDASPLGWSYLGNAVDCLQKGMKAALDDGLDDIYDQLDTIAAPMAAAMKALQVRMQRESAYSLDTILEKIEKTVDELDKTKETLEGLMDKVDC